MSLWALLAFAGAYLASFATVGYLTLRVCFYVSDRLDARRRARR